MDDKPIRRRTDTTGDESLCGLPVRHNRRMDQEPPTRDSPESASGCVLCSSPEPRSPGLRTSAVVFRDRASVVYWCLPPCSQDTSGHRKWLVAPYSDRTVFRSFAEYFTAVSADSPATNPDWSNHSRTAERSKKYCANGCIMRRTGMRSPHSTLARIVGRDQPVTAMRSRTRTGGPDCHMSSRPSGGRR